MIELKLMHGNRNCAVSGRRGLISSNVESISEAMGIVLGMHGGKKL